MKSKVTSLLLMLLLFPVMSVMAQTTTVKGIVTDTSGEPLIGVSVIVEGTSFGTQTNIDGEFSIKANPGDKLNFTYIGYRPVTLAVPANGKVDLVMEEEATALDEVVVTALGIKREQKALSYNVQTVKGDAFTSNKDANFINSLAGKVAGVNISSSSAGSGSAARVIMRGQKSLSGNDNALYVIDGIPMFDVN